jgi:hypothetical protein
MFPLLLTICRRQFEMMHLQGIRSYPELVNRAIDMSQSLEFTTVSPIMGCITPSGQKYLTGRCRNLLGEEGLRLQGIWFENRDDDAKVRSFPDPLLRSLAGVAKVDSNIMCSQHEARSVHAHTHADDTEAFVMPTLFRKCFRDFVLRSSVLDYHDLLGQGS